MTYQEYLKSLGATEDEVKVLATPVAIRAFDKMQSDIATANAAVEREKAGATAYQERANAWFDEQKGKFEQMERDLIVTRGNETRARTALLEANRLGLLDVAKDLGYDPTPNPNLNPNPNPNPAAAAFDSDKYTREVILPLAEREGDAIALAQDIAAEHRDLFPDKPLNFRALRIKARDAKKPLEQVWMEDFGVVAAREARTNKAHDDEIAAAVKRGRDEVETEYASRAANPNLRLPTESISPFAPRPTTGRDKQPWERGTDDQNSIDRVTRTTQHVLSTLKH